MLIGRNDFASNFGLLGCLDLNKLDALVTALGFVIKHGGVLGNGLGCHHLPATSTNRGHTKQPSHKV